MANKIYKDIYIMSGEIDPPDGFEFDAESIKEKYIEAMEFLQKTEFDHISYSSFKCSEEPFLIHKLDDEDTYERVSVNYFQMYWVNNPIIHIYKTQSFITMVWNSKYGDNKLIIEIPVEDIIGE